MGRDSERVFRKKNQPFSLRTAQNKFVRRTPPPIPTPIYPYRYIYTEIHPFKGKRCIITHSYNCYHCFIIIVDSGMKNDR